jgi:hypothetical protein
MGAVPTMFYAEVFSKYYDKGKFSAAKNVTFGLRKINSVQRFSFLHYKATEASWLPVQKNSMQM